MSFPGEEYVPVDYRAVTLPFWLENLRRMLFGHVSDTCYVLYRLWQAMRLLHTTELAEFVTALDPRITYLREANPYFDGVFGTQVAALSGAAPIYVFGEAAGTTVLQSTWRVTVTTRTPTVLPLRLPRLLGSAPAYFGEPTAEIQAGLETVAVAMAYENQLSDPVTLPGSALTFRVPEGISGQWQITATARPELDFADLMSQLYHSTPEMLFMPTTEEPWRTFYNVYAQHPSSAYRYCSILLAMAYRIDQIRQGGGNG
jgi:hypothetical protein